RFYEIISAFVDSEATALEQLALQEHIKICPKCKAELDSQYALKKMLGRYPSVSGKIDVSADVMRRISAMDKSFDEMPAAFAETNAYKTPQWLVIVFMLVITAATVFSAHRAGSNIAGSIQDPVIYTSYIYEHVNDNNNLKTGGNDNKQLSFSR
ncbi:MAG: zf-HC2 domain-containing protein, partial [Deferribacteraceae bacterium]|nr:zf-HC2 domain-containing protein [Deferribacteraceae bacterium]